LRGLAVDARGAVYVAATGCRCVVKLMPDGHVETILKADAPWSPTGVALRGDDVFVLEYNVINDQAHKYLPPGSKAWAGWQNYDIEDIHT